jgi:uncharacterized protein YyaL (SSP411 family)
VKLVLKIFLFALFLPLCFKPKASLADQEKKPSMNSPKYENRLIKEKSPYLLQHAHNPVDWYPWGEEAFEKSRKEDKPIFLSIGYSTCHWCHVMERESFENESIAAVINQYFVPIKVDREERPDIDNIYMSAVMAMSGQGGWPLNVFLTPDRKPFFGGTYFPPHPKWGNPGIVDVLSSVHQSWVNRREYILKSSEQLTMAIQNKVVANPEGNVHPDKVLTQAYQEFERSYDQRFGGFGSSPKFPSSHNLSFLFRYGKRHKESQALKIAEHTLIQMAKGGIYDHLGGGFHRYSTDQEWQVPHFEKMLYDQALLVKTYAEAYQITKDVFYREVIRETADYVLRELRNKEGGFYSAEDADSLEPGTASSAEKKEGAFYIWRAEEISQVLSEEETKLFNYYYDIHPDSNVRFDSHGEFVGKNILYIAHSVREAAEFMHMSEEKAQATLKTAKEKLLMIRSHRPRPHLDDKILVDWNGLMISALAYAGSVLNEPRYIEAAEKSTQFILKHLKRKDGRLLHRFRDKEAAILGTLEDYAFFVHGLIDLYEATLKIEYLKEAMLLNEEMIKLFWDDQNGGFFFTGEDSEQILFRQKEIYDGAIPSGNSFACLNLARLGSFNPDNQWSEKAQRLFAVFSSEISRRSSSYAQMLMAVDYYQGPNAEVVFSSKEENKEVKEFQAEFYNHFLPSAVLIFRSDQEIKSISSLVPFVENQVTKDGLLTVYVCENRVCKNPTSNLKELQAILSHL